MVAVCTKIARGDVQFITSQIQVSLRARQADLNWPRHSIAVSLSALRDMVSAIRPLPHGRLGILFRLQGRTWDDSLLRAVMTPDEAMAALTCHSKQTGQTTSSLLPDQNQPV